MAERAGYVYVAEEWRWTGAGDPPQFVPTVEVWREENDEWAWKCGICPHTGWNLLSEQGARREAERHRSEHHALTTPTQPALDPQVSESARVSSATDGAT